MDYKIFIGYDYRIGVAADVLAYSLRKYSSVPLNIKFLKKDELNFNREDDLASTQFTYTRFLVPYLCNYDGIALFMDNDMLAFSDIKELFDLDMSNYALRVTKHNHNPVEEVKMDGKVQSKYPRKNWSSLMLMDCSKLKCWTKEAVETMPAKWLHRFETIDDKLIGDIDYDQWNVLDQLKPGTKLWHFTTGGPYFKEFADMPNAGVWYKAYYDMMFNR
jgi:lipopolysaccharide biosynthesis glycosyltransferase